MLLIKTTTDAIPAYVMQSTTIPQSTVKELERITRKFFWEILMVIINFIK